MKTIYLNGIIGEDILLSSFGELNDDLICYLNSPGGSLAEAREIFNAIKNCKHKTTVIINPTVASCASYICMAFNEIKAYKNSAMMIHRSMAMLDSANVNDLAVYNELLLSMDDIMADEFAKKTGMNRFEVLQKMDKDYWIIGDKLVSSGIINEFIDDVYTEDIYMSAKSNVNRLKKNYASNYKTDLDTLAAKLNINPRGEDNKTNIDEEKNMTLQEFLKDNPDAASEFESEVASACAEAVKAERERIANLLLASEETEVDEETIAAIQKGIKFDTFAKMKFAQGRERQKANALENAFIPSKVKSPFETNAIDEDALKKAVSASTKKFGLRGKK